MKNAEKFIEIFLFIKKEKEIYFGVFCNFFSFTTKFLSRKTEKIFLGVFKKKCLYLYSFFTIRSFSSVVFETSTQRAEIDSKSLVLSLSLANGHITLNTPVLVRSPKLSNVEPS